MPSRSLTGRPFFATPEGGVVLLILTTLGARLLFAHALGLGVDESYMVAAGRSAQSGYFDHPPIAWWMAWGASRLAGSDAPGVVRLPFILMFAGSTALMFGWTRAVFGSCAGLWAAAMMNAAPVLGVTTATWVLPDGPMVFFLLAAAWALTEAIRPGPGPKPRDDAAPATGRWGWWLLAGGAAGLALCSKYIAGLTCLGALGFLLLHPDGRRWLSRPQPYVAAALALLLFLPVVAWNASHGWASFLFQGGRASGRFHPFGPLASLGGEALFLLPWIFVPLMLCAARAIQRGLAAPAAHRDRLLMVCLAAPPILVFTALSFRAHILFHWAAPGYLMLFPMLGDAIGRRRPTSRRLRAALVGTAAFASLAATLIGTEGRFHWLPRVVGASRLGDDPLLEAVDWTSVRADLRARGVLARPNLVLATLRWKDSGKLDYAMGGDLPVLCLCADAREYGLVAPHAAFAGSDVLIVAPRTDLAAVRAQWGDRFDLIEPLPPSVLLHAGRRSVSLPVYLGHRLHVSPTGPEQLS